MDVLLCMILNLNVGQYNLYLLLHVEKVSPKENKEAGCGKLQQTIKQLIIFSINILI